MSEEIGERTTQNLTAWLPLITGGSLIAYGLGSRSKKGLAFALVGGGVIWAGTRGPTDLSGYDPITGNERAGFNVRKSITVNRPPEELYQFWRHVENLPTIMHHLESVTQIDEGTSHWIAKAPAGRTVEWDAHIVEDEPNRRISWRSAIGADVENMGTVEFVPGPRGTVVRVWLRYKPPAGILGKTIARLFGEEPSIQIAGDLRRFKQLLETGEITTSASHRLPFSDPHPQD